MIGRSLVLLIMAQPKPEPELVPSSDDDDGSSHVSYRDINLLSSSALENEKKD